MPYPAKPLAMLLGAGAVAMLGAALLSGRLSVRAAELNQPVPAPALDESQTTAGPESIVLSGGCFWGVQGVFEHLKGVRSAVSGYAGGSAATAEYETVSTGTTGHAESVRVTYDPAQVSLGRILQVFFSVALDPTEVGHQGPDYGSQYRSEIWVATPEQRRIAEAYVAQLDRAHVFPRPIATRVDPLTGFYPAERYHQDFLVRYPDNPYIAYNDIPKVEALQSLFPAMYRADPVLVLKQGSAS